MGEPRLIVELLSTVRLEHGDLVDELADGAGFEAWLHHHLPHVEYDANARRRVVSLRERVRDLLAAAVDGDPLPAEVIADLNRRAARSPVTLAARMSADGSATVERVSSGSPAAQLDAEFARSALTLAAGPDRRLLRRCRAPDCILFFLQQDPRQHWCSPGCGNRARVARHRQRQAPTGGSISG